MAEVTIKWLEDKRLVGIDSSNHSVVISGAGELGSVGVKPSELLLMALGSCTAYDVIGILQKKRQAVLKLEVHVTAEQQEESPWTFTSFHVHYIVTGINLSEKAVDDAITLSDEKYCSVSATLKKGVPVTHDFEIVDAS